eukprot:Gregarina_sp_Poly_1__2979@NODE_1836_length_3250_cov_105_787308_g971_i1_p5_GENE_NODE_1836_length_3250_cov_105_787308_g971_i1NODE_1836_length_3250_cov_105_787308_g971_i1_p5_ORF_typecomplete_len129_score23_04_NODE_1836_length_3250_cov_105_787308_g971_i1578964
MANTQLGERLVEFWKSPEESEENRQNIRKIVSAIIKPIIGLRYNTQQPADAIAEKVAPATVTTQLNSATRSQFRAAPPRVQARQFRVAPKSQVPEERRIDDERLQKIMDSKLRQPKRKPARSGCGGYY